MMNATMPDLSQMMPEPVREALTRQGERVLAANRTAATWQLDQARAMDKMVRDSSKTAFEAGLKGYEQAMTAVFDAQTRWLDAMAPAKAEDAADA